MPPGFIGVGAGEWKLPDDGSEPPGTGEVELYYCENNSGQLRVGRSDGTIVAVGAPAGDGGQALILGSYAARGAVFVCVSGDSSPPFVYRASSDGGATFADTPYPLQDFTDYLGNGRQGPSQVATPTDWFAPIGLSGEGFGGEIGRVPTGPAGTAYVAWSNTVAVFDFALGAEHTYAVGYLFGDDAIKLLAGASGASLTLANIASYPGLDAVVLRGQANNRAILITSTSFGVDPVTISMLHGGAIVGAPSGLPTDAIDVGYLDYNNGLLMVTTIDAAGTAKVFRSSTNGASWVQRHSWAVAGPGLYVPGPAPPITACPATPGVWWVGWAVQDGASGWWRTADDGDSWTFVPGPPAGRFLYHGAGHPSIAIAGAGGYYDPDNPPEDGMIFGVVGTTQWNGGAYLEPYGDLAEGGAHTGAGAWECWQKPYPSDTPPFDPDLVALNQTHFALGRWTGLSGTAPPSTPPPDIFNPPGVGHP